MGNHWHLVVRPETDDGLGRFMGWVGVTHVRRHHEHYRTRGGGHLYQGRFKSFPVQEEGHFLSVCRYVEANAVRARLVTRVADWPWCGYSARRAGKKPFVLAAWPVDRPRNWRALVQGDDSDEKLDMLRACVNRGRPFGDTQWIQHTARRLGLDFTLRNAGQPRKKSSNQ